jgi:hypothetical protein
VRSDKILYFCNLLLIVMESAPCQCPIGDDRQTMVLYLRSMTLRLILCLTFPSSTLVDEVLAERAGRPCGLMPYQMRFSHDMRTGDITDWRTLLKRLGRRLGQPWANDYRNLSIKHVNSNLTIASGDLRTFVARRIVGRSKYDCPFFRHSQIRVCTLIE